VLTRFMPLFSVRSDSEAAALSSRSAVRGAGGREGGCIVHDGVPYTQHGPDIRIAKLQRELI
jgi:hypothetical protein